MSFCFLLIIKRIKHNVDFVQIRATELENVESILIWEGIMTDIKMLQLQTTKTSKSWNSVMTSIKFFQVSERLKLN